MDLNEIISFHVKLKIRIRMFIKGVSTEALTSRTMAQPELCELGIWLDGAGKKYESSPYYKQLKDAHKELHKYAAEVIKKVEEGDSKRAIFLLEDPNSGFTINSYKIAGAVVKLQNQFKIPPKV